MGRRVSATYSFYRLGFRADVIEPLAMTDVFRIETPEGAFQMSKADFRRVFANVAASASYRDKGLYHYPRTPEKALQFLVT
jgi:hypothetical protein